jgi:hypothetical protein
MRKGEGGYLNAFEEGIRPKKKGGVTYETPHKESKGINFGII